jgi:SAM-dependent methyltransferase
LNPRPSQNESTLFYPKLFYQVKDKLVYKIFGVFYRGIQVFSNRIIVRQKKRGRLLDIGCGRGDYLLAMQRKGYDVYGVDISEHIKNFIPDDLKKRVYNKNVEECHFPEEFFDIVTMFQSLEHVSNLNETLGEIRKIIKDDGILYISVPNNNFFEFLLFGPYYYNLEAPRHLYFFTKMTLTRLLTKYEFGGVRFIRNNLFETVSTPASFYHGLINFLDAKNVRLNGFFKAMIFVPLVLFRFILRSLLFFEEQNLKAVCFKNAFNP